MAGDRKLSRKGLPGLIRFAHKPTSRDLSTANNLKLKQRLKYFFSLDLFLAKAIRGLSISNSRMAKSAVAKHATWRNVLASTFALPQTQKPTVKNVPAWAY